jgi:type I site-specific restriction endonuclease
MNKKSLSERDICTKFITPALEKIGWDTQWQIFEEVSFTDGKIYVRGKITARRTRKRADYILYYKPNIPIAIIAELIDQGVMVEALYESVDKQVDLFDLICHVAYDKPPLTRKERANNVKKRNYFTKYGEQARKVLEALLDKYADQGIKNMENIQNLTIPPNSDFGSVTEIIKVFGSREAYDKAIKELENELYKVA